MTYADGRRIIVCMQETATKELADAPIRLRPSTRIRLQTARIVDGETLDSVVNRALDALKKSQERS